MPFLDGALLTAADLNALDNRTVPVFESEVARDAALGTPTAGRVCVVAGQLMTYSGTGWSGPPTPKVKIKTEDESVTSSTTLQADNMLNVVLTIGWWRVQAFLIVSGDTAGDLKAAWSVEGTGATVGTCYRHVSGPSANTTAVGSGTLRGGGGSIDIGTAMPYGTATGEYSTIAEDLHVNVTSEWASLRLTWAQNVASATPTIVRTGSRIYVTAVTS